MHASLLFTSAIALPPTDLTVHITGHCWHISSAPSSPASSKVCLSRAFARSRLSSTPPIALSAASTRSTRQSESSLLAASSNHSSLATRINIKYNKDGNWSTSATRIGFELSHSSVQGVDVSSIARPAVTHLHRSSRAPETQRCYTWPFRVGEL